MKMENIKKENKFLLLLFTFALLLIVVPFLGNSSRDWEIQAFYCIILVTAIYALRKHKRHFIFSSFFVLSGCSLQLVNLITCSTIYGILGSSFYLCFYFIFIQAILNDVMKAHKVTRDSFCGAICAYFMIAIFFNTIYGIIEYFAPGSFAQMSIENDNETQDLLYFSFMTLTTVGYGDIVPVGKHAKSFVIIEGITGVFYIGILVSHLMGGLAKSKVEDGN